MAGTAGALSAEGCPPPDPRCGELLQEILEFIAELHRRWWEFFEDPGTLPETRPAKPHPRYGYRSRAGEREAYGNAQKGLRNRIDEWNEHGCGPPPSNAWEYAWKELREKAPVPPAEDTVQRVAEGAAATGVAIGVGYLVYRAVRLIPSLIPPLWPTLVPNLAIP
jgi:WTIP toxin of polymorphic toxin system component